MSFDWTTPLNHAYFRSYHATSSPNAYWNDAMSNESDDATTLAGHGDTLQRHSRSELYAIYRPSIDGIDRYVTPIWYVAGFPGNALAFLTWTRSRMRASSGCFLAALAFNDLVFLALHLVFELQATWDVRLIERPGICQTFPIAFLAAQYLNPLLVLGFSVERYIAICHPFRRPTYCTTSRAVRVIVALVVFSLAVHSVQGYFWHYNEDGECGLRDTVTESGADSLWSIWSWTTELVVFGVVPLVIFVLNVAVIAETRRLCTVNGGGSGGGAAVDGGPSRSKDRSSLSSSSTAPRGYQQQHGVQTLASSSHSRGQRHKSPDAALAGTATTTAPTATCLRRYRRRGFCAAATTAMLLAVSFYLICATLPVTVCYVLHLSFPEGSTTLSDAEIRSDPTWQAHFDYWNVRTIIEEMSMSHYACNFYIYLLVGKIFRAEFVSMFSSSSSSSSAAARAAAAAASTRRMYHAATDGEPSAMGGNTQVRQNNIRRSPVSVNGRCVEQTETTTCAIQMTPIENWLHRTDDNGVRSHPTLQSIELNSSSSQ